MFSNLPTMQASMAAVCLLMAAAPSYADDHAANQVAETLMAEMPIPALSVAVYHDGELVWADAYGRADIELDVAATEQHRFRLGSVSKIVTASLAARMVDAGLVDLDAPISQYLPELPGAHHATTLRQLLTHQGGIRHYNRSDQDPRAPGSIVDLRIYPDTQAALSVFINDPLIAAPGTTYSYSTYGYTLASAVLEAAGSASFAELIEAHIAAPLHLRSLETDTLFDTRPNRVSFYDSGEFYRQRVDPSVSGNIVNALSVNPAYKWAGGGLIATPSDLARFGAAFFGTGFLATDTYRDMFTIQNENTEASDRVGLGWRIDRDSQGRLRYHHAGLQQGTRSVLVVYPESGLAVAMMSNLGGMPQDILTPATMIAETFLD